MSERPSVAVLGAINVDLVVAGASLPRPGETVTGGTFARHHGGKGGNQAVAAARTGAADVWMVGAVGDDALGAEAIAALRADGVWTEHIVVVPEAPTGVALIAVGTEGENQISVAPGANLAIEDVDVHAALETIAPDVVLCSLEIGEGAVRAALAWAREHDVTAILNPAPWQPWARALVGLASIVTPNEHERAGVGPVPSGVVVVETRGAGGAVIGERAIPAPDVQVVDTTGAGDCFNGVLAAAIAAGRELTDAVTDAVVAATLSVGLHGARDGMPGREAIAEARSRSAT